MRTLSDIAEWMAPRAKAVGAAASAFVVALLTALPDGVTATEWSGIVAATLAAGGVTYAVPNRPKTEE